LAWFCSADAARFPSDGRLRQGIKSFKKGLSEDEKAEVEPPKTEPMKTINHETPSTAPGSPVASGASAETRKAV
jgi:hypothetical protein